MGTPTRINQPPAQTKTAGVGEVMSCPLIIPVKSPSGSGNQMQAMGNRSPIKTPNALDGP